MSKINITLNGSEYAVEQGVTILEAARENGVHIPTLCHFEGIQGRAKGMTYFMLMLLSVL